MGPLRPKAHLRNPLPRHITGAVPRPDIAQCTIKGKIGCISFKACEALAMHGPRTRKNWNASTQGAGKSVVPVDPVDPLEQGVPVDLVEPS